MDGNSNDLLAVILPQFEEWLDANIGDGKWQNVTDDGGIDAPLIATSKIAVTLDNYSKKWYNMSQGDEKMGKMLHNEARELLVESYEKTHNAEEIAKIFGVNKYTVYHMAERKRKTGSVALRTSQRGRKQRQH